jgi:hypothetical protein
MPHSNDARRAISALALTAALLAAGPVLAAPAPDDASARGGVGAAVEHLLQPLERLWHEVAAALALDAGTTDADAGLPAEGTGPVALVRAADEGEISPALDPNGTKAK